MSRADGIVEAIDVGLQRAMPDPTFGEVSPVNRDECWRCSAPSETESGLCGGCRSFLLEDSDEDPARPRMTVGVAAWLARLEPVREIAGQIQHVVDMYDRLTRLQFIDIVAPEVEARRSVSTTNQPLWRTYHDDHVMAAWWARVHPAR